MSYFFYVDTMGDSLNMPQEVDFSVLTMNCWGIPVISKDRKERMNAIASELSTGKYDIVCLQEVWSEGDYTMIKEKTCEHLPHSHYFFSGVIGSGLCVLSKFPIEEVFFHQWAVNGYVHKIQHGDWFGGKGVGLCRVRYAGLSIHVYTAHLHAEYDRSCDMYKCHRVLQAFDTAQFIQMTSANADMVVLGGDLNTEPNDLPYRIICYQAGLHDTGNADEQGTNESFRNSYSDPKAAKICPNGKRIDYIMYKTGTRSHVQVSSYSLPLPERVPQCRFSYSDHEAVLVNLTVQSLPESCVKLISKENDNKRRLALKEGIDECTTAFPRLTRERWTYYIYSILLLLILLVICGLHDYLGYGFFDLLRILVTIPLCFTLFMATLWNKIEVNATRASKLAMELAIAHDIT